MFQLVFRIILGLLAFWAIVFPGTGFAELYSPSKKKFEILSYMGSKAESEKLILVNAGDKDGMRAGTKLNVYRDYRNEVQGKRSTLKVLTGRLEVVEVQGKLSVAKIIQNGSILSRKVFHDLYMPIASDYIEIDEVTIENKYALVASESKSFFDIFMHPKAKPNGYEMSPAGYLWAREIGSELAGRRIELVLVEGHTDPTGNKAENQRESYLRALAVREFLVSELKLDPERVKAVGFGESQLADRTNSAGSERRNRRIIIKAIPYVGPKKVKNKVLRVPARKF